MAREESDVSLVAVTVHADSYLPLRVDGRGGRVGAINRVLAVLPMGQGWEAFPYYQLDRASSDLRQFSGLVELEGDDLAQFQVGKLDSRFWYEMKGLGLSIELDGNNGVDMRVTGVFPHSSDKHYDQIFTPSMRYLLQETLETTASRLGYEQTDWDIGRFETSLAILPSSPIMAQYFYVKKTD